MAETNYCLIQGFEWNTPADQKHWKRLTAELEQYKKIGISNLWIPPACKGAGGTKANGYDIYDLYDLGEFEQMDEALSWALREWAQEDVIEALEDLDECPPHADYTKALCLYRALAEPMLPPERVESLRQAVVDTGLPWAWPDTETVEGFFEAESSIRMTLDMLRSAVGCVSLRERCRARTSGWTR